MLALHARTTTTRVVCHWRCWSRVRLSLAASWVARTRDRFQVSRLCGHAVTHGLASLSESVPRGTYTVVADAAPTATLHPVDQTLTLQPRGGPWLGQLAGGFLSSLVHLRSPIPMTIAASRRVPGSRRRRRRSPGCGGWDRTRPGSISCPGQDGPYALDYSSTTKSISHPGEGEGVPACRCRGRLRRNGCTSVLSSASAATSQRLLLVR